MKTHYEVWQDSVLGGWENNWTIDNDGEMSPQTFPSATEAKKELDEFLKVIEIEHLEGNISSPYDKSEFKIVRVCEDGKEYKYKRPPRRKDYKELIYLACCIVSETQDAHSRGRYSCSGWLQSALFLLKCGCTKEETDCVLRSKIMRWAADNSNNRWGNNSSNDLKRYFGDATPEQIKEQAKRLYETGSL